MVSKLSLILLLAVGLAVSEDSNPGLAIRITKSLLDEIKQMMTTAVHHKMDKLVEKVPELPYGGKVKKVDINVIDEPNVELKFASPNKLVLDHSGGKMEVSFETKKDGNDVGAKITIGDITSKMELLFSRSDNGHLQINAGECNLQIGEFNAEITGLPQEQIDAIQAQAGQLKNMVGPMMCPQLKTMLMMASAKLDTLPTTAPLFRDLALDFSLVQDPVATDDYMEVGLNGQVFKEGEERSDYRPKPLVKTADNSAQIYFFYSEEHLNSFMREYHRHGLASYTVTKDSDEGKYERMKKILGHLADAAGKTLPDGDFETTIETYEAPEIRFKPNEEKKDRSIKVTLPIKMTVKNINGDQETVVSTKFLSTGYMHMEIGERKDDAPFPDIKETIEIDSVEFVATEGYELTDEQKTAVSGLIKGKLQEYINKKLIKRKEEQMKMLERPALKKAFKIFKMDDVHFKVNEATLEAGFSVKIDMAKALAEAEDMEKVPDFALPEGN